MPPPAAHHQLGSAGAKSARIQYRRYRVHDAPKGPLLVAGGQSRRQSNTWFLGHTRVHTTNRFSHFAWLTNACNRQPERHKTTANTALA